MYMQMPEMDGIAATRILRRNPRLQTLPIIAMTAHALAEERQRCLAAGMNDHLSKPIDPDVLFPTLLRWAKPRPNEPISLEISGINMADGVRRVAGNKRLHRDLLMQFAAKQGDAAAGISAAITNGDLKLAERMVHTVEGVAGNIGIADVQSAAQKLEKAIRDRHESIPSALNEFAASLGTQVVAIRQALHESPPGTPDPARTSPFNREAAADAIARLRGLLEASEGAAQEAFYSLREALEGTVEESQLNALGGLIHDFDFDAALLKLNRIADVWVRNGDE
jgi:CheY-like chemotaxis protein